MPVSRRAVLSLLASAAVAACTGDDPKRRPPATTPPTTPTTTDPTVPTTTTPTVPGRHPFDVIAEIRDALRASPDALEHEAARRVAAGDPQAILDFVRDSIQLVPASADGFGPADLRRGGARGALRCGVGTLRDKAELLQDLFVRAGFSARLLGGPPTLSPRDLRAALEARAEPELVDTLDDARVEAWLGELGAPAQVPLGELDPDGDEASALAADLLASLPASARRAAASFSYELGYWLFVEVEVAGAPMAANPFVPGSVLGESHCGYALDANAAYDDVPLELEVYVATTAAPRALASVVRGEWRLSDLAGRLVRLAFVPTLPAELWLASPVEQVRTFVPYLAVEGPDLDDDGVDDTVIEGSGFGVDGALYVRAPDGTVTLDGALLSGAPTDPALLAQVTEVTASAGAAAFPTVDLRVGLRGASGPLEGVRADAFEVTDEGVGVAVSLLAAEAPAPRVLFVLDRSPSIPAEFTDESAALLVEQLATAVLADVPDASFAVRVVELGLQGDGAWTSDPAAAADQARNTVGNGSELWLALAAAADLGPAVVVLITDGVPTDTAEPGLVAAIQGGPPVIGLAVGAPDVATLDRVAALSTGSWSPVADADEAEAAVVDALAELLERFYVLRFHAAGDAPDTRAVRVVVNGIAADAAYEVPARPLPGGELSSVWLRVGRQGVDHWRRLAGSDTPDAGDLEDVHLALFGTRLLSVELGAPSPTRVLDDLATALLTRRAQWDIAHGEPGSAFDALLDRTRQAGAEALWAAVPLAGAPGWFQGPRLAMWSQVPKRRLVDRELDLFGLAPHHVADPDPAAAFEAAVHQSAGLALAQAALVDDAPAAALSGEEIVWLEPLGPVPPEWDADTVTRWLDRAALTPYRWLGVPADGRGDAWWVLHAETGTVVPAREWRGGLIASVMDTERVERAQRVLDWGGKALSAMGGGLGPGVILAVHKGIATLVIRSTIAINTMDASGVDAEGVARQVLGSVVKQVVKATVPGASQLWKLYGYAQKIERVYGALTGESLE